MIKKVVLENEMKCVSADFKTENGKNKLSACHADLKCWLLHVLTFERLASEKFSKLRLGRSISGHNSVNSGRKSHVRWKFRPSRQQWWLSGFCDQIKWTRMLRYGKYFSSLIGIVDDAYRRDGQLINSIIRKMKIDDALLTSHMIALSPHSI